MRYLIFSSFDVFSVMVLFEDKYRKECDVNEVIYDKTFEQYQKVLVKSNTKKEKEYKEGVIIHCSRYGTLAIQGGLQVRNLQIQNVVEVNDLMMKSYNQTYCQNA